jgi:hypothetical protein
MNQRIAEVEIHRDDAPLFLGADGKDVLVRRRAELLFGDGRYVVARLPKKLDSTATNVFVKLEFHDSIATST